MSKLLTPELKKKLEDNTLVFFEKLDTDLETQRRNDFEVAVSRAIDELGFSKPFSPKNTPEFQKELREFSSQMYDRLIVSYGFIDETRYNQEVKDYWKSDFGLAEIRISFIDTLIKRFGVLSRCEFYLKSNIVYALDKLKANKHLKRLGLSSVLKNEDSPEKDYGC